MAIEVADIVSYWRTSELNAIADYDNDGSYDSKVIESAIEDAYAELSILTPYIAEGAVDVYAKRLTICTMLSRLNVNPEAVSLPMNDCFSIRETLEKFIQKKLDLPLESEANASASNIIVTKGNNTITSEMENF